MAAFKSPGEKTEVPKGVLTPLRAEAPKGVLTPLRNEAKINGTPQGQKARERCRILSASAEVDASS